MASATQSRTVEEALAARQTVQPAGDRGVITLGPRAIRCDEIASFAAASSVRRDFASPLVTAGGFGMVAAVVALGVLGPGMRGTLLLTAATFGLVAFSALDDLRWGSRLRIFTLDVVTRSGERIRVVTSDPAELARLVALLECASGVPAAKHRA